MLVGAPLILSLSKDTVEVLTWKGFVRYHVFFLIELCTRRVHVAGITRDPTGAWMEQIARNLTDAVDGPHRRWAETTD
jgi:hypothetical protein